MSWNINHTYKHLIVPMYTKFKDSSLKILIKISMCEIGIERKMNK